MCGAGLALSTRTESLRHIDAFYLFCDERGGPATLDAALGASDVPRVIDLLTAFYAEMSVKATDSVYAAKRFASARRFIDDLANLRVHSAPAWAGIALALKALAPLASGHGGKVKFIRALPSATLADVLTVMAPDSERNPASDETLRARNWLVANLLLLLGLRRGECLILPVDALKSQLDVRTGETRWWLDVVPHLADADPRFTKPSLKTVQSRRQLPVSPSLARLLTAYIDNWRGSPEHEFLLTSRTGSPLSAEAVNAVFRNVTSQLSEAALREFKDRTGGKESVSPHDLRHTCAVVRLKQFLGQGLSHEETMQRMRSFFGWSYESIMPLHYAKAAFEERLAQVWGDTFDEHTSILRNLPQ